MLLGSGSVFPFQYDTSARKPHLLTSCQTVTMDVGTLMVELDLLAKLLCLFRFGCLGLMGSFGLFVWFGFLDLHMVSFYFVPG